MTHLTDLQFSMIADGAIESGQAVEHLASCSMCQGQVAAFSKEKSLLGSILAKVDSVAVPENVPRFTRPAGLRELAVANVIAGLAIWFAQFLWKTLFGELIVNAFSWLTSIPLPDIYALCVEIALYFTQEGTAMIYTYFGIVATSLLILIVTWLFSSYRKGVASLSMCCLLIVGGSMLMPTSAEALVHQHSKNMLTISEAETINDTVVATAELIEMNGAIDGDLIAIGRRVIVNGTVSGNLFAFAETVTVRGQVGGTVIGFGSSVEIHDALLDGDFWGVGEKVVISPDSRIGKNAVLGSEIALIDGKVSHDLVALGERVELNGTVGEDFEVFSHNVSLLGDTNVGGNVRFRTDDEENLTRSSSAKVGGEVEYLPFSHKFESRNKYKSGKYYLFQLLRLLSGFLIGVALFWLLPGFGNLTLSGGVEGLKTAGIGLVTLVSVPMIAVLFAITLVGLPFTVVGLFSWFLIIYFAKIVLAAVVGRLILSGSEKRDSLPLALLLGLVVILIAVNLPAIGGIISFLLTIVGMGLIVQRMMASLSGRSDNHKASI